eukprot:gnl/MRDRNA2_/MRDRNA2_98935_c0_seq1.p1 gnl/MRDRNA2_/MRDRNA2_98935_c0~~gnl/MRDRNA2_/MRDRNA2_98935_c0_seq1.p1  ORF type:complete len:606 (+),score=138.85 gnl/MRDRNA2_/MRDRNA2_98935_c0_seq1:135-1952(+)
MDISLLFSGRVESVDLAQTSAPKKAEESLPQKSLPTLQPDENKQSTQPNSWAALAQEWVANNPPTRPPPMPPPIPPPIPPMIPPTVPPTIPTTMPPISPIAEAFPAIPNKMGMPSVQPPMMAMPGIQPGIQPGIMAMNGAQANMMVMPGVQPGIMGMPSVQPDMLATTGVQSDVMAMQGIPVNANMQSPMFVDRSQVSSQGDVNAFPATLNQPQMQPEPLQANATSISAAAVDYAAAEAISTTALAATAQGGVRPQAGSNATPGKLIGFSIGKTSSSSASSSTNLLAGSEDSKPKNGPVPAFRSAFVRSQGFDPKTVNQAGKKASTDSSAKVDGVSVDLGDYDDGQVEEDSKHNLSDGGVTGNSNNIESNSNEGETADSFVKIRRRRTKRKEDGDTGEDEPAPLVTPEAREEESQRRQQNDDDNRSRHQANRRHRERSRSRDKQDKQRRYREASRSRDRERERNRERDKEKDNPKEKPQRKEPTRVVHKNTKWDMAVPDIEVHASEAAVIALAAAKAEAAAAAEHARILMQPQQPSPGMPHDNISVFVQRWRLDTRCEQMLRQAPAGITNPAMQNFSPREDTVNVSGRFISFFRNWQSNSSYSAY